ncbi:MAG: fatty acid desaturase, partial [Bacteroidota bacterium]|nr:fatty acid desaturase [Bacteroidota bacterium]
RSNDYGVLFSFLTCYHFGYHEEHHTRPGVPWWRLPAARREHVAANAGK